MSDTPKKFPIPQIERAIHESLNPKGMSTHSGKVTLDVSWVQRLLILAEPLLRQENEYICKCGLRVEPHRCKTGEEF